jgi:copper chaperone CopZ
MYASCSHCVASGTVRIHSVDGTALRLMCVNVVESTTPAGRLVGMVDKASQREIKKSGLESVSKTTMSRSRTPSSNVTQTDPTMFSPLTRS